MLTDIHTHIVPNVDDGARSTEESLALLDMLAAQGVCSCIATPHFYAHNCQSLDSHIERVSKEFAELKAQLREGMPHIYLGHEVHYFKGISCCEDIKKLTINNSKYILLELPYSDISESVVNEIIDLNLNLGLKPILAHVERYIDRHGIISVFDVIRDGYALAHINCDMLLDKKVRKLCFKLIEDDLISFVASDTHSVEFRPPRLDEGLEVLERKFGSALTQRLIKNAFSLIASGDRYEK